MIPARGKEGFLPPIAALPWLRVGGSRSLHNVTYVTYVPPDCPMLPGAGEAPRRTPCCSHGEENPADSRLGFSRREWEPRALCASLPSAGRGRCWQPSPTSLPTPGSRSRALLGCCRLCSPFPQPLLPVSPRHSSLTDGWVSTALPSPGYWHKRAAWSKSVSQPFLTSAA